MNLRKLLYTKFERYLMRKNRCFVIDGHPVSSSNESELHQMREDEIKIQLQESPNLKTLLMGALKTGKCLE